MPGAVDPVKTITVVLIALTVLVVLSLAGLLVLAGRSEAGYQAYADEQAWLEGQASDAGIGRPCYEALRDSLTGHRGQEADHESVAEAAQAIRRDGTGWPRDSAGAHPCP